MKNLILFVIGIFLCLPASLQAQWKHLGSGFNNPAEGKIGILDLAVIDTNTIWALPELSAQFFQDSVQRISRTLDGGQTWDVDTIAFQEGFENKTLFAKNADTAWVVTQKQSLPHHSKIYRTNDGGDHWTEQSGPFNTDETNIRKIHFFNAQVGVAYGNRSYIPGTTADSLRIYRTTNGGSTWNQVHRTQLPLVIGREMGTGGFALGDTMWIGTHTARLWRSVNQGQSWTADTFPVTGAVSAIHFKNHLDGIAVSNSQTIGARTTDGGNTWTTFTTPFRTKLLEYIPGTAGSYILVANNWWQTPIYITHNNGGQWDRRYTKYSCYTKTIKMNSPTNGFIGSWVGSPSQGGVFQWTGDFGTPPADCFYCSQEITKFPYVEDFEGTGGAWCQQDSWGIEWMLNTGDTPYRNTGPDSASSGSHYLYMESGVPGNYPNGLGILGGPCFQLDSTCLDSASLTFNYHMNGLDVAFLRVTHSIDSVPMGILWGRNFNQGNNWHQATINLKPYIGHQVRLIFGARNSGPAAAIAMDNIRLDVFSKLQPSVIATDPACAGDSTGQINLQVARGAQPYQYLWSTGDTIASLLTAPAGSYTVEIIDANGCEISDSVSLYDPPALSGSASPTAVTCNGLNNGKANTTIRGGTGNLHFLWSTGDTVSTLSNLSPGTYTISVTDDKGCLRQDSVLVTEPLPLQTNLIINDVSCPGDTNGSVILIPTGGNPPYSYGWSPRGNDSILTNLKPGRYNYILSDRKNCFTGGGATIKEPDSVKTHLAASDVTCYGLADGEIKSNTTGGTGVFSYQWSNGGTTDSVGNLDIGTYAVLITDSKGCTKEDSTQIIQPDSLAITFTKRDESATGRDAYIIVSANGGARPYSYFWAHDSSTSNSLIDLTGNKTYYLTITDANGCILEDSIFILSDYVGLAEDLASISFKLFPNPVQDKLYISYDAQQGGESLIRLYDLSGKLLLTQQEGVASGINLVEIQVENLASGTYLLSLQSEQRQVFVKWVKN